MRHLSSSGDYNSLARLIQIQVDNTNGFLQPHIISRKWVEAIPKRETTDTIIINFLEENILAIFGCLRKIIVDNAQAFKFAKLVNFCQDYNIELGSSTAYYP